MRKRYLAPVLLALLAAAFAAGVLHLFQLRFGGGDVYAPYSSLRADPLGAKAFHDSLKELPGLDVTRNLKPMATVQAAPDLALLHLGTDVEDLDDLENSGFLRLRNLAVGGARVVVALVPTNDDEYETWFPDTNHQTTTSPAPLSQKGMQTSQRRQAREARLRVLGGDAAASGTLSSAVGVELVYRQLPERLMTGVLEREAVSATEDLNTTAPWHSALGFRILSPEWHPVLERDGLPVAVERKYGRGSLVLMTDSYPFSNEAVVRQRNAPLMAWAVGDRISVMFEETHFGIGEEPGIASLAREYRLHGFVAGIGLLAGLFLWRASSSLIPRRHLPGSTTGQPGGRDAQAGLVHLLRRSVSRRDLLEVCLQEWQRARTGKPTTPGEAKRVENVLAVAEEERERNPARRNPVETYRQISRILNERK